MNNNMAFVAYLRNITPIEGADKIVKADVVLNKVAVAQVVVGKDSQENSLIVYFDSNLCLDDKIIADYPDLGDYLAKGNRVKAIRLRGTYSIGLTVDAAKFNRYFKNQKEATETLVEGYSFTEIGKQAICKKWYPPIKIQPQAGAKKARKGKTESRMIDGQFHFHVDTDQLLRNAFKIIPEKVISISSKWHGTSSIASHCLVKKKLNPVRKAINKVLGKAYPTEYDYIYSSRTVVKNATSEKTSYYSENIWTKAGKENFEGKLLPGESVYFEIVGYLGSGSWIQKNYDYGCAPGEYKIRVYRITLTTPHGSVFEYSWQAVKERCQQLGVVPVTEYFFGRAQDLFPELNVSEHWNENFVKKLQDTYLEKVSTDCKNKVPDEGIVLRVESLGIEVYKLKSQMFMKHESDLKDQEVEDIEDQEAQDGNTSLEQ